MPRSTQDLDLVIDPPLAAALETLLERLDGFYLDATTARAALAGRGLFSAIERGSGWKVDFIVRKARPFSAAEFRRRCPATIAGVDVFLASPVDTILSKLEWSRAAGGSERQRRDINGMLAAAGELDRDYLEQWIRQLRLEEEWGCVTASSE